MSQHHHQHQYRSPFGDTTYTKVFVGGLAWETPTERMQEYFEQFGKILEAVVITDKNTGKSKGYGFVTFSDPESARRACENTNPMIDGRRANCNIASFGRPARPSTPRTSSSPPPPQYGNMPTQAIAPHPAANPYFYQSSYGYAPYAPAYGYHQAMYNAQYQQQAQYYQQLFGSSVTSSMTNPYGYGYALPGSRPTYYPTSSNRMPGSSYVYYPAATQMDQGPSSAPYSPGVVAAASTTVNTSLQNPPSVASLPSSGRQQPAFSFGTHFSFRFFM